MSKKRICPFKFKYRPESQGERLENELRSDNAKNRHFTLNHSAVIAKLHQLNDSVSLDLVTMNKAESYRLSSYSIFRKNLLDPITWLLIIVVYIITYLLTIHSSVLSFILLYACIYYPINCHLESYKSFAVVSAKLDLFRKDLKMRNIFLSTFPYKCRQLKHIKLVDHNNLDSLYCIREKKDTFRWANELIAFFWPHLSQLIHCQLDEFFHAQIESGRLAKSDLGVKKFCAALIKQLKSNILEIKRCQFGSKSFEIKNLTVSKSTNPELISCLKGENLTPEDEFLVYNLDLEYNGNMIIKVIYRYFYCCSSKLGLEDVYLHFKIRFLIGPLKRKLPFVERISFTLMELPEYGYKGIALVELAELKAIRGLINGVIRDNILYPKLVSVTLKEVIDALMKAPKKKEQVLESGKSSCLMMVLANSLLCSCMCVNMLLRPCHQSTRGRHTRNRPK